MNKNSTFTSFQFGKYVREHFCELSKFAEMNSDGDLKIRINVDYAVGDEREHSTLAEYIIHHRITVSEPADIRFIHDLFEMFYKKDFTIFTDEFIKATYKSFFEQSLSLVEFIKNIKYRTPGCIIKNFCFTHYESYVTEMTVGEFEEYMGEIAAIVYDLNDKTFTNVALQNLAVECKRRAEAEKIKNI